LEFFRKRERRDAPETIDLDNLYYNRNSRNFLKALRTFPVLFNLTLRQLEKQVIDDLKTGSHTIHPELYKSYSENLRKGVGGVMKAEQYGDKYFDIQQQLQVNVSRFAAYKAYHATQQIQRQLSDKNGTVRSDEDYRKMAKVVFDAYNRYQPAEYNTAVARTRTAKQWIDFNADQTTNELYPNLKWLPSRSADPREEHRKLWGLILPKTHPFWKTNQPGNLWNCGCDWEETDEQPYTGELPTAKAATGLEGNPGETGEIFTKNAAYYNVSTNGKQAVQQFFEPIENNHKKFIDYSKDNNYNDVSFSWNNGGLTATHKDHIFDPKKGSYEKNVQNVGYKNGNSVIFESETGKGIGERYTEGFWDGKMFEIASTETGTDSNILKGLKHCASKRNTEVAVIYFPNKNFELSSFNKALSRYKGLEKLNDGQFIKFNKIVVVESENIKIYDL
jgi:hypothetical protein